MVENGETYLSFGHLDPHPFRNPHGTAVTVAVARLEPPLGTLFLFREKLGLNQRRFLINPFDFENKLEVHGDFFLLGRDTTGLL